MGPRVTEQLIALGNLRASAHATVAMLASEEGTELARVRHRLAAAILDGAPIGVLRASAAATERELGTLCVIAANIVHAGRQRRREDDRARVVLQRLEADVCIAGGVLATTGAEHPASGVHRASSAPPDAARQA